MPRDRWPRAGTRLACGDDTLPTSTRILEGLATITRDGQDLAIVWHALIAAVALQAASIGSRGCASRQRAPQQSCLARRGERGLEQRSDRVGDERGPAGEHRHLEHGAPRRPRHEARAHDADDGERD